MRCGFELGCFKIEVLLTFAKEYVFFGQMGALNMLPKMTRDTMLAHFIVILDLLAQITYYRAQSPKS